MASGCCCVAVRDRLGGGSVTSRARGGARGAAGAGAGAGAGAAARFLPLGAGARTDAGAGAGAGALLLCTTGLPPASSSAGSSISPARELSKSATISGCKCATGLREVGWRATTCIRAAQGVPKSWFEGMLRTPKCPPPRYIPPMSPDTRACRSLCARTLCLRPRRCLCRRYCCRHRRHRCYHCTTRLLQPHAARQEPVSKFKK